MTTNRVISLCRAAWLDQYTGQTMINNGIRSKTTYRRYLYLLTTMALVPAFVGIYWLSFWLRFGDSWTTRNWRVSARRSAGS